jgi:hypothetical protein
MKRFASMLGLGAVLVLAGCQTQFAGTTLPSPRYIQHPSQFIPDDDDAFPLPNELAYQQSAAAQGLPGGPPAAPRPVPPR